MLKPFLSVGVLAFGSLLLISATNAAVRVGDAGSMSLTPGVRKPPCGSCSLFVVPRPGDTTSLNSQPLPLKMYGNGRMLRR
jgi:hypothetical protein